MACERGVPAADDFVPVLVYVLIKVFVTWTFVYVIVAVKCTVWCLSHLRWPLHSGKFEGEITLLPFKVKFLGMVHTHSFPSRSGE